MTENSQKLANFPKFRRERGQEKFSYWDGGCGKPYSHFFGGG